MKNCLLCKTEFEGTVRQVYCSKQCRNKHFRTETYVRPTYECREDLEGEIWKVIENTSGKYSVSNTGLVRTNYKCDMFTDYRMIENYNNLMILTPKHGYLAVNLYLDNNKKKGYQVHRLVAYYFIENPKGLLYVNHKDFDKKNNHVDNLEWCTNRDNVLHGFTRRKTSSSYPGVSWSKVSQKWGAWIKVGKDNRYLGIYKSEIEAHEAYMKVYHEVN